MRIKQSAKTRSAPATESATSEMTRLHALIENCPDIPAQVRHAEVSFVDDRTLDDSLFRIITGNGGQTAANEPHATSVQRRIDSLTPYIGRRLVCLVIRLPGVRYTIEIDPAHERIVHWECQTQ